MNWHAVTTCNHDQWTRYGRAMVNTFVRHWSGAVDLTVYAERFDGDRNGRVRFVDLDQAAPWLGPWKAARTPQQRAKAAQSYKFDAARFAHKVAAIGAAAEDVSCETDHVLIWLDADIVTHAPVMVRWLRSLWPETADMAWLDRDGYYPECGFMMFRLPACLPVIRRIVMAYQTGEIFRLQQWHDSYVIQTICGAAQRTHELRIASLSGDAAGGKHPLALGPLGRCLDHLKGKRKEMGRSPEAVGKRKEAYWR